MTLEQLVEDFAQNVVAQSDAVLRGDPETANVHTDRFVAAFDGLTASCDSGRDALTLLFHHPRPDVRGTAAAFLLRYRTAESKAVLEALAAREGLAAFRAQQVLARWAEGTWALDPG